MSIDAEDAASGGAPAPQPVGSASQDTVMSLNIDAEDAADAKKEPIGLTPRTTAALTTLFQSGTQAGKDIKDCDYMVRRVH